MTKCEKVYNNTKAGKDFQIVTRINGYQIKTRTYQINTPPEYDEYYCCSHCSLIDKEKEEIVPIWEYTTIVIKMKIKRDKKDNSEWIVWGGWVPEIRNLKTLDYEEAIRQHEEMVKTASQLKPHIPEVEEIPYYEGDPIVISAGITSINIGIKKEEA